MCEEPMATMVSTLVGRLGGTPWRPWPRKSLAQVAFCEGERRAVERISQRLFGRILGSAEFAGLAGAPDDGLVEVGVVSQKLYLELSDPANHVYGGSFFLQGGQAPTVLLNDGFCIYVRAMRRRGLGLHVFHRQVQNAASLDIRRIDAVAGRAKDENGYYTWPRYGFQAPLPPSVLSRLPLALRHCRTILQLMASARGREWWGTHGETLAVRFDLTPGSRSWATLASYVLERRRCGVPDPVAMQPLDSDERGSG
jgi:hypothetical protein